MPIPKAHVATTHSSAPSWKAWCVSSRCLLRVRVRGRGRGRGRVRVRVRVKVRWRAPAR